MKARDDLDRKTVETIQDLVRVCVDTAKGLRTAADTVQTHAIASYMRSLATERESHANELREFIEMNEEEAQDAGSIRGTLHRWWLNCRGTLNGGDDRVVLIELERSEDDIKRRYEQALPAVKDTPMHDVVRAQYERVTSGHDTIRDLRDALQS